eukprot:s4104_g3.t1
MPCIMLFGKPLPSRTPSPEGEQRVAKRRQILRVEVSTAGASTDAPFRSVSLDIPTAGHMELSMRLSLHDLPASPVSTIAASDQASTVQVEDTEHTMGTNGLELPPPTPHGLANFGLSATTYSHLWEAWRQGGLSVAEIRACHGPQVAQMVMDQWGSLPLEAYLPTTTTASRDTMRNEARTTREDDEGDEEALVQQWLQGWQWTLPVVMAMPNREEPFFTLARNMVRYLGRQGASVTVLATVLQELAWERENREYNLQYEEFLGLLGLPWECDRDRSDDIEPHHRDVLVWLETELWNEYIELAEVQTGFESEQLMAMREQECLPEADCQVWRQWATQVSGPAHAARSPTRTEAEEAESRASRKKSTDPWSVEL